MKLELNSSLARAQPDALPAALVRPGAQELTQQATQQANQPTVPTRAEVARAVAVAREELQHRSSELNFSLDDASGELVVKIIDSRTREVLRQMPSEEALSLARSLEANRQGALITARA